MQMKTKHIILLIIGLLVLNPRTNLKSLNSYPGTITSCSTGWSLNWGNGFIGIFSLESSSRLRSNTTLLNKGISNSKIQTDSKEEIMNLCL